MGSEGGGQEQSLGAEGLGVEGKRKREEKAESEV